MSSGKALSGLQSLDSCLVVSLIRLADEKSQMSAPSTRAYLAKPRTPPRSLLTSPKTGTQFSTDVSKEAMMFAMMGTMTQSNAKATTLQNVGKVRNPVSTSASLW